MTGLLNILIPPERVSHKVGLFFGSFNPVHIGHMAIANYLVEYTTLQEIWFVVSPHNPLKNKEDLLNDHNRLELMRKAVGNDNRFRVSDAEFHLPKPSYTFETLKWLEGKFPDHEFCLVMGGDNLRNFNQWRNYQEILEKYPIIVYPRRGSSREDFPAHPHISHCEAPMIEISSTFIRKSISEGKDLRHFMPPKVWEEIDAMNYYRK